ncbi:MAG: hypothetical protein ACLUNZ_00685 [Evtepia sp.]
MKICKNYINGEWVESVSGKTAPTYNPANGEILAGGRSARSGRRGACCGRCQNVLL